MQKQIEFYENKLAYEMDPSDLWDALEKDENTVALDARKAFGFEKEHIPTAINIPHREMNGRKHKTFGQVKNLCLLLRRNRL